MKKIILTLAIQFVLNACSKDDSSTETPLADNSVVLLKKLVTKNNINTDVSTSEMTYDGNKIVQMTSSHGKIVYTYTGNLITKTETSTTNSTAKQQTVYTYESDKLISSLFSTVNQIPSVTSKIDYTYNSDNTISYIETEKTNINGIRTTITSGKLYFSNGNLVKKESQQGDATSGITNSSVEYLYDTKNNPFNNVLGYNKLLESEMGSNNLLKTTGKSSYTLNGVTTQNGDSVQNYNYTSYNDKGYPLELKIPTVSANGFLITTFSY
jgi:uncharacterized lipoprotein YehR (DUF1307 family)